MGLFGFDIIVNSLLFRQILCEDSLCFQFTIFFIIINILRTINSLRLPEKVLFGRKSRCNQMYSLLNVFVCLLTGPCFMIRNPYNYVGSPRTWLFVSFYGLALSSL